jgi:hypothetical protein
MTPKEAEIQFRIGGPQAAIIAPCFDSADKMKAIRDLFRDPENLDLLWDDDFESIEEEITAVLTKEELEVLADIADDPDNLDVIDLHLTRADPELALRLFG